MSWDLFLKTESDKQYFKDLMSYVKEEYEKHKCHPDFDDIFNAFKYTDSYNVKVVILGQDPYHNDNEAHGLSFSVLCDHLPPSLKNIYKEMSSDLGVEVNQDGNLTYLAKQGVLLLNTTLTVRHNEPLSHAKKGWEEFSDNAIKFLNTLNQPIVYILWGNNAHKKEKMINNPNHLVIKSPHPSPLGAYRGFFGSKPFSKTNEYLKSKGIKEINWVK